MCGRYLHPNFDLLLIWFKISMVDRYIGANFSLCYNRVIGSQPLCCSHGSSLQWEYDTQWDMSRFDASRVINCASRGPVSCHLVFLPYSIRIVCLGLASGPKKIAGATATQSQLWNQAQLTWSLCLQNQAQEKECL